MVKYRQISSNIVKLCQIAETDALNKAKPYQVCEYMLTPRSIFPDTRRYRAKVPWKQHISQSPVKWLGISNYCCGSICVSPRSKTVLVPKVLWFKFLFWSKPMSGCFVARVVCVYSFYSLVEVGFPVRG